MKKYSVLIIVFILVISIFLIFLSFRSNFPHTPPTLEVSSQKDNINFNAETNGGNWFDSSFGKGGNSFDLGAYDSEKLTEINEYKASVNTKIQLSLSYTKDIKEFKVYLIDQNSLSNENNLEVKLSNNTFTTPKEPGIYGYIIETFWNDSHNIRFIFKLNCK
ncbi:hypothetical protein M4I33_16475 [Clostridium sp. LY3-2]|uniref:hypothetical protein n=1 Tax=Clostridium sp. LY3-2 TaxID=2942482 RepID=UPI00215358DA|nr:hypothetical protein [Clostridium sp. LY3-2]MCR6516452.1 hypothetical protein [Clostridium sp. LY3-2]